MEHRTLSIADCCFDGCKKRSPISATDGRVEVRTVISEVGLKSKSTVRWTASGDARFHIDCWETVVKACRARSKKRAPFAMSDAERSLVKEALKTAEFHDSVDAVANEASRIAELIKTAKHCVAFTGAGISTSAGIGDYRGKSGKWTEEDREASTSTAVPSATQSVDGEPAQKKAKIDSTDEPAPNESDNDDDGGVPYEDLRPTYTHEALHKLVQLGFIKHIISQNGDGLHGLSGIPDENLSELHGNVFVERCKKCGMRYKRPFYVLDDNASLYYEEISDFGSTALKKPRYAKECELCGLCHRTGRKCTQRKGCKGHLIDTIINFQDNLEEEIFTTAQDHAQKCDLMLCLGTTMTVSPANELVEMGKHPLRLVVCNRQKTDLDKLCNAQDESGGKLGSRVFGDCDQLMSQVMRHLVSHDTLQEWETQRAVRMRDYERKRTKT